jgi:hypothetical protein
MATEKTLLEIANEILADTNGGLEIILQVYPEADTRKQFKLRPDEKTASASLFQGKDDGIYRIKDFGTSEKPQNAIYTYAIANNLTWTDAVLALANQWGQRLGKQYLQNSKTVYKYEYRECALQDFEGQLNPAGYAYKIKEQCSPEELASIGPFVSQEHCQEVRMYALEYYQKISKCGQKVQSFKATEFFPIFAFINITNDKEWLKIYQPKASKRFTEDGRDYRFMHLGHKPPKHVYNLDEITKLHKDLYEEALLDHANKMQAEPNDVRAEFDFKLDRICIASGGSDGLNLKSMGEQVIWFNSESEKPDKYLIDKLQKIAYDVVNIPDNDNTGEREGKALALEYLNVKSLWLSEYRKDVKDFKDFVFKNRNKTHSQLIHQTKMMLEAAKPAQFWEVKQSKSGALNYNFHHVYAFYFLGLNGFCRINDEFHKDGFYFGNVQGHVVKQMRNTQAIKDVFNKFLAEKQRTLGVRKIPHDLRNKIIASDNLADSKLSNLQDVDLDFCDYTKHSQHFFLKNKIIKVDAQGIHIEKDFKNYVMEDQIIENLIAEKFNSQFKDSDFKVIDDLFTIKNTGENLWDIDIASKDCVFLNYLTQTSRVYWQKEHKHFKTSGKTDKMFYEDTKFNITSEHLSPEENEEQKMHLISKLYCFGYLLHRYKDPVKSLIPYAVDNNVEEDAVSEGGSGKSNYFKAFQALMACKDVNGRMDIEDNRFLYEGVSKHTDLFLIDDAKKSFDLSMLYQQTQGLL